jgi:hypothetical protein
VRVSDRSRRGTHHVWVGACDLHKVDACRVPLTMCARVRRVLLFEADCHYREGTRAP